jgi:hypothetical protein
MFERWQPTVGAVRPVKAALTESNYFSTRDSGGTLSPGPCERTSAPLNKAEVLFAQISAAPHIHVECPVWGLRESTLVHANLTGPVRVLARVFHG